MTVIQRAAHMRAVLAELPLGEPHLLLAHPATRSASVLELERRFLLPRSWSLVACAGQLNDAGDFVAARVGNEEVVVVRDRDGELRALNNVCTHRASTLVQGVGNCGRRMVCPYHGWTFDLDGSLRGVPYRSGFTEVPMAELGLGRVRFAEWGGLVLVDISGVAEPLGEPPRVRSWSYSTDEVDADWKQLVVAGLSVDVDEVLAPMMLSSTVVRTGGLLRALRYEPLDIGRTRVHRFIADQADTADRTSGDPNGSSPTAALTAWREGYAEALRLLSGPASSASPTSAT